jgi:hypothetical protein
MILDGNWREGKVIQVGIKSRPCSFHAGRQFTRDLLLCAIDFLRGYFGVVCNGGNDAWRAAVGLVFA